MIEPVTFRYNGKAGHRDTGVNVGVIAQDVQKVLPGTVKKFHAFLEAGDAEATELLEFNPHEVMFLLVNAVKELSAKIKELEK